MVKKIKKTTRGKTTRERKKSLSSVLRETTKQRNSI